MRPLTTKETHRKGKSFFRRTGAVGGTEGGEWRNCLDKSGSNGGYISIDDKGRDLEMMMFHYIRERELDHKSVNGGGRSSGDDPAAIMSIRFVPYPSIRWTAVIETVKVTSRNERERPSSCL